MKIWRWITGGLVGGSREFSTEYPTPKEKNLMAKKAPNYSPELTDAIVADYQAGKPVEDIADAIGKSVRSVRSKLVREGVYVAQEKPKGAKRDNGPTKKELFADLRAALPDVPDGAFAMSKEAMIYFIAKVS
tara:strand:+ start:88 stop:483 length:396 start_codon:yes stop_codon:yes gene_type:complete